MKQPKLGIELLLLVSLLASYLTAIVGTVFVFIRNERTVLVLGAIALICGMIGGDKKTRIIYAGEVVAGVIASLWVSAALPISIAVAVCLSTSAILVLTAIIRLIKVLYVWISIGR